MSERDCRLGHGWLLASIWLGSACLLALHARADVGDLDGGEIGGAAYLLGVAHPTGFSIDMLLLRAATSLPLGPLAFRQNLMVALLAATVVTGLAALCHRHSARAGGSALGCAVGALLAASALLSSQTFIAAAVSVEVYASALGLTLAAAWLAGAAQPRQRRRLWVLAGFALGAHVTAPLAILPLCAAELQRQTRRGVWLQRALLAALGAVIVVYLPLASRRDGAFDWGDPETLRGMWRHLSAARIREAYASELWRAGSAQLGLLFEQLFEQPLLCVPAAIGCGVLWRRQRGVALLLGMLLSLDLAYAAWVNPMGIAQRQLGHVSAALLAFAAGSGGAFVIARIEASQRWLGLGLGLLAAGGAVWQPLASSWPDARDRALVVERYGASSGLLDLAPRAVYLCASDSACASALFAVYAEGARPDLAVVPAQHLWDATVARRLVGLPVLPAGGAPHELAARRLSALARSRQLRPLYAESWPDHGWSGLSVETAPYLALAVAENAPAQDPRLSHAGPQTPPAVDPLLTLERARFGPAGPQTPRARELWASAHAELGKALLREQRGSEAVLALQRALALTPASASANSNLGVAFEATGDIIGALRATERAVELDPRRPTPWVNLARLMLRARGSGAARMVLAEARRHQLQDARLFALQHALDSAQGATAK